MKKGIIYSLMTLSCATFAGEVPRCPAGQEPVCDTAACNSTDNDQSKPCDCLSGKEGYKDSCRNPRKQRACETCCREHKVCAPKRQ